MTKPSAATTHGSARVPTIETTVVATTCAAPDSASSFPKMLPRPMTIAMNPSVAPTPSWKARTAVDGGMPAPTPSASDTSVIERKA